MPVQAFVEGIGGEVSWNDGTQTTVLKYDGKEVRLTIGSTTAYLDNVANEIDIAPVIINGRTMLPIRFVAESFEYTVIWSQEKQIVTIINADTGC